MNRYILLLFACLFYLSSFGQQSDKEKAGLKGNIQFVKLFSSETRNGTAKPQNTILYMYNEKGELIGNTTFNGITDQELTNQFYQYKNGMKMREEYSNNGVVGMNKNYVYENGVLSKIEHKMGDKIEATDTYTYNDKKQLTVIESKSTGSSYTALLNPSQKKYYSYDDKGNLAEEKTTGAGSDLTFKNSYNKANQKIKTESWNNGKLTVVVEYQYDKNNRVSKETKFTGAGKMYSEAIYKYDDRGRKTGWVIKEFEDGKTYVNTRNWKYDGDNEVEDIDNSEGQTKKQTTQYEFDKQGNWIKKKVYQNGNLWLDQRREITYRK